MTQSFHQKLTQAIESNNSLLCIGLDPNPHKYPAHFPDGVDSLAQWGQNIINQTADLVCCYKPNFAFYEQNGPAGLEALKQTINAVPAHIPVLLDAKRGDIGSTAEAYARAAFEVWGADAITVSPYLGQDSIDPFLAYPGKTIFVLCYTSNPSAQEIQTFSDGRTQLYEYIVRQASTWGDETQVAFVVGATQPDALTRFRALNDRNWILAPGIGAQGGDLAATLTAGLNSQSRGLIVPASRAVIYADDPRSTASALRNEINQARKFVQPTPVFSKNVELITSLHELNCVQLGNFTLASGQQSPIYIDLRRMIASASLMKQAAQTYADIIRSLSFDQVAGVPYGALPMGTLVAQMLDCPLVFPRKEAKAHGTAKQVEGVFKTGDRVIVVEDTITSGGNALAAIKKMEDAGLVVSDVVVLVDRGQGAAEKLAGHGYALHTVLTMTEILDTLHAAGRISSEQMAMVQQYLIANS